MIGWLWITVSGTYHAIFEMIGISWLIDGYTDRCICKFTTVRLGALSNSLFSKFPFIEKQCAAIGVVNHLAANGYSILRVIKQEQLNCGCRTSEGKSAGTA